MNRLCTSGCLPASLALALATSEANASREKARREIDSQRDEALSQLKSEAENLGDLIVERLLAKK